MQKNKNYKWCIVPLCKSTSIATPEKCFIQVPKNDLKRRKLWIRQLETDMENFIKWKMMGGPKIIKKEVVPHKFECQKHRNLTTVGVPFRKGAEKRKRLEEVQKALQCSSKKSNLSQNSPSEPEVEENEPGPSFADLELKNKDVG
ncbi:hypothetical protein NQ315_007951, partial [Exocentrus adspersus]